MMRTIFEGWKRYHEDGDARVRVRFSAEASKLRGGHGAALWAMERYFRDSNAPISARALRREIERDLGGLSWAIDRLVGPMLLWRARREAAMFPAGRPLEPQTFVERRNW